MSVTGITKQNPQRAWSRCVAPSNQIGEPCALFDDQSDGKRSGSRCGLQANDALVTARYRVKFRPGTVFDWIRRLLKEPKVPTLVFG